MLNMHQIALDPQELTDIARAYGKVYLTAIGEISYTKLVKPDGFVLLAKDDQLRFYMFKKPGGVWELVWGASSIVHDGLPISEHLIQWRLNQALKAGKQGLNEAEALGKAELDLAANVGTEVHQSIEQLLSGKEVNLAGLPRRVVEHITSLANFVNDHEFGKLIMNEQIVALDRTTDDGVRVVYAGTTDWIVEIKDKISGKFELWLIDFKTSADAYLSHKLQAIGYKEAAMQSLGLNIDRVGILLLGRATKTGYNLVEVGKERGYQLSFKDFELVYRMLLLLHKGKLPAPSYKTYPKSIKLIVKENKKDANNNHTANSGGGSIPGGTSEVAPAPTIPRPKVSRKRAAIPRGRPSDHDLSSPARRRDKVSA